MQGVRGTKPQKFPGSNFLRTKNFLDKVWDTLSQDKPQKRVFASHESAWYDLGNAIIFTLIGTTITNLPLNMVDI